MNTLEEIIAWDITRKKEKAASFQAKQYNRYRLIAQEEVSAIFGMNVQLRDTLEKNKFYLEELNAHVFLEEQDGPELYGYVDGERRVLRRPADFAGITRHMDF